MRGHLGVVDGWCSVKGLLDGKACIPHGAVFECVLFSDSRTKLYFHRPTYVPYLLFSDLKNWHFQSKAVPNVIVGSLRDEVCMVRQQNS